jgi:hypothetical protein
MRQELVVFLLDHNFFNGPWFGRLYSNRGLQGLNLLKFGHGHIVPWVDGLLFGPLSHLCFKDLNSKCSIIQVILISFLLWYNTLQMLHYTSYLSNSYFDTTQSVYLRRRRYLVGSSTHYTPSNGHLRSWFMCSAYYFGIASVLPSTCLLQLCVSLLE